MAFKIVTAGIGCDSDVTDVRVWILGKHLILWCWASLGPLVLQESFET
jgi:hypothetical protein